MLASYVCERQAELDLGNGSAVVSIAASDVSSDTPQSLCELQTLRLAKRVTKPLSRSRDSSGTPWTHLTKGCLLQLPQAEAVLGSSVVSVLSQSRHVIPRNHLENQTLPQSGHPADFNLESADGNQTL